MWALLMLLIISGCSPKNLTKQTDHPMVISPKSGAVWMETYSYKIRWKGIEHGNVCIAILLGGKDKGIINDCKTPAQRGVFIWKIPRGFVSYFGINKEDKARVVIFTKTNQDIEIFSDYFTISKPSN
ncbi:hypothetical protein [Hippea sp. KM1]|uniref:hypothetical protein n=1 Tax=Hippea sp. KM1 TaxID=944481 RepID=UPI00046CF8B0|nr:hypothetical protein [Hippea sp. KM1]